MEDESESTVIDATAIFEQRRRCRANIPDIYNGMFRRLWDKAMAGRSLRVAVDAKCADCSCWQNAEIRECTAATCPLWPYRKLKSSGRPAPEQSERTNAERTCGCRVGRSSLAKRRF
jgi:hypothetical protein